MWHCFLFLLPLSSALQNAMFFLCVSSNQGVTTSSCMLKEEENDLKTVWVSWHNLWNGLLAMSLQSRRLDYSEINSRNYHDLALAQFSIDGTASSTCVHNENDLTTQSHFSEHQLSLMLCSLHGAEAHNISLVCSLHPR